MDKFVIVTFESVNFAMQTESILKNRQISHQIIPTPREITLSCGLSIKSSFENKKEIGNMVDSGDIRIKKMYILEGVGKDRSIEEI